MECNAPGCDHTAHDASMAMRARCHPTAGTWCFYRNGVISVRCRICERLVAEIAVAERTVSTDLETIKALLSSRGIGHDVVAGAPDSSFPPTTIVLHAMQHEKVNGYPGFVAEMYFSETGELVGAGVLE